MRHQDFGRSNTNSVATDSCARNRSEVSVFVSVPRELLSFRVTPLRRDNTLCASAVRDHRNTIKYKWRPSVIVHACVLIVNKFAKRKRWYIILYESVRPIMRFRFSRCLHDLQRSYIFIGPRQNLVSFRAWNWKGKN